MLLPQTLTIIFVSYCFKNGISLVKTVSIPGFCKPIALIIPPYVSAILGVLLPAQATVATPFVVTAPNLFKSTYSAYSIPEPNVPEATVTGFLKGIPAISTFIFIKLFIKIQPPLHEIQVLLYKYAYFSLWNVHQSVLNHRRTQDMHLFRTPFFPQEKDNSQFDVLARMP